MESGTHHVPFDQLVDLAEGRPKPAQRTAIVRHLSACARCAATMTSLEHLVTLMRTDDSVDPPARVVARAVRLMRAPIAPTLDPRRRLVAALRFDSGLFSGLVMGLRAGLVAERQMLFGADEYDVELRVAPAGEDWTVAGQVLGPCENGQVEIEGEAGRTATDLNSLCEFTLPPVPEGTYTLTLRLDDLDLEVSGLVLGA